MFILTHRYKGLSKMTQDINLFPSREEKHQFSDEIKEFIATGLRDEKIDPLPIGSSFLNLRNRVIPQINVDDHLLPEYGYDFAWRKDK